MPTWGFFPLLHYYCLHATPGGGGIYTHLYFAKRQQKKTIKAKNKKKQNNKITKVSSNRAENFTNNLSCYESVTPLQWTHHIFCSQADLQYEHCIHRECHIEPTGALRSYWPFIDATRPVRGWPIVMFMEVGKSHYTVIHKQFHSQVLSLHL